MRKEYTFSKLLCPHDSDNDEVEETIKLTLPTRVVPGSVYATLSAIGEWLKNRYTGDYELLTDNFGFSLTAVSLSNE